MRKSMNSVPSGRAIRVIPETAKPASLLVNWSVHTLKAHKGEKIKERLKALLLSFRVRGLRCRR